ncbi:MAG: aspartate aminotransferase family protein [Proteobacteria bacterium]|nr:aspartate aminotransferase family protein [Pseudomonadota bacterium]
MEHSAIIARRTQLLAPTYQLFYEQPLQVVRARDVWMYDEHGRAYLDAYNNVPVVGHCHPEVVEALTRQASILNTHTRYLAELPLQLAEDLLATMPREISNVVFTCTGSEANDLAVRISKAVTGGTGFIITDYSYHGVTDVLSGMSPEDGPVGPGVYTVPSPGAPEGPAGFAAHVQNALERMRSDGIRPAALLVDTIFSSDGVFSDPKGFLAEAVRHMRDAGGLFIADEVQPGFGRLGEAMWGFQRHGVVPDIVTMGKPMGNGHPVAAVAARPEVFAQFARGRHYFNTFGGNSVSCAVALAVLQVIHKEGLLENARRTGEYLRRALVKLASRCPALGEVRGAGLFVGVEVRSDGAGTRASALATKQVVNAMRHRGVLLGSTGRGGNVLKIRTPLTFKIEHADTLVQALDDTLQAQREAPGGD